MFQVLELAKKRVSLLSFIISNLPGLIQLGLQLSANLSNHACTILQLLEVSEKVSILSSQLSLGILKVSQGEIGFLNLLVEVIKLSQQVLVGLFSRSLGAANFISGGTDILNLMADLVPIFFNLSLHLGELINLLSHLGNSILVLSLEIHQSGFLLNMGLFKVLPELLNFGIPLLVKLNLSCSSTSSFIEPLTKFLKLSGKIRPLALSLGSCLPLGFKLFF